MHPRAAETIHSPELSKHIQCGDWSDVGNTGDQVCPSAWSRFNKHALCTTDHAVPNEYFANAKLTSFAWEDAMNKQMADAQRSRAMESTDHPKYGENLQVINHIAPAVFVGRGLGDMGRPRDQHATRDPRKQVIEVMWSMHAKNAKIQCVNNRCVYGTTGRMPEPITHGKTMVHPGAIKTDATLIACLQVGNFRTPPHARIIIQAISGCTENAAKAKVANA